MNFERLRTNEGELFSKALELYTVSFPLHERRKFSSQTAIMGDEEYHFNLIYDKSEWVGIILCWETVNFIYVEHFCTLPEMRSKRYGQKALELLNCRGKKVILEIDPPIDEVSRHRKAFYERVNYKANDFAHVHLPYREAFTGHSLVVMSYPERLSKMEYDEFNLYLRKTVMGL